VEGSDWLRAGLPPCDWLEWVFDQASAVLWTVVNQKHVISQSSLS